MKGKIFLLLIVVFALILTTCKNSTINSPVEKIVQPGSRDYIWTEDTLKVPKGEMFLGGDLWGSSPDNVWAIGGSSLSQLGIWHYDGKVWKNFLDNPTGTAAQTAIYGTDADNVWLGNFGGYIWRYDGSMWNNFTQLQVPRYQNFGIQEFWAKSVNEIYAVGVAYYSYFKEDDLGCLFKYDGTKWGQIQIPKLYLNFNQFRIASNGDYLIRAFKGFIDSTKILTWDGKVYKTLFADIGFASYNVFNIGETTLFNIGKVIYEYDNDGTYKVWKDYTGTDYYDKILCSRSEKDFFVGSWSLQGINHYNGTDLKLIYSAPNTRIGGGLIFDKDVFFTIYDNNTNVTRIVHGRLKE